MEDTNNTIQHSSFEPNKQDIIWKKIILISLLLNPLLLFGIYFNVFILSFMKEGFDSMSQEEYLPYYVIAISAYAVLFFMLNKKLFRLYNCVLISILSLLPVLVLPFRKPTGIFIPLVLVAITVTQLIVILLLNHYSLSLGRLAISVTLSLLAILVCSYVLATIALPYY